MRARPNTLSRLDLHFGQVIARVTLRVTGSLASGSELGTRLAVLTCMAIDGVITTKEVLRYGATIVREFGAAAYLRCCAAILLGRRTTFLSCVIQLSP